MTGSDKTSPPMQRHVRAADISGNKSFDRLVALTAKLFRTPYAALTVAGLDRQFVVANHGLGDRRHPMDGSPSYEIVLRGEPIVIPDLDAQSRYRPEAFFTPHIKFFAGVPLVLPDGFAIGCLGIADSSSREADSFDLALLRELADIAVAQVEMNVVTGMIDPVTRLPNRAQFILDMTDWTVQHAGQHGIVALVDIMPQQQVDAIMRVLGPGHLDQVVADVAQTFQRSVDKSYRLYQISQTQLALLPPPEANLDILLSQLSQRLSNINRRQLSRFAVTIAMGILPFKPGDHDAEDILRMANSAAQDARQAREYIRVYSPQQDRDHQRRFAIVSNFAAAMESEDELFLVYQPRVDLSSGRCYAAEALLRWTHSELGSISPSEFIPLIDPTMLMQALTDRVLKSALDQLAEMRRDFPDFIMAVNVSAHNLREPDFLGHLLAKLEMRGLPPHALEVEITEGTFILNDDAAMAALHALAHAGVRIAIDDFGTGYSSLSYLEQLPAHTVKLDQSFMHGMTEDRRKYALVSSTISLCHELGYRVIAEGVETMEIADQLRAAGCDEAQGYGFSKPVPAATLLSWLKPRYGLPACRIAQIGPPESPS
ncbi:EAL domain-containing protein [Acidisoma cellulosilytica]|uniref:EAL domain-containing protein n=1 Tax=Acidisoma cellulosilyticum TaxID=2802395 RepID=A0A963YZU5_9PROT|nr:EAL domain-containing protein [Acidisoma cellulosilyticum]MCB8879924.1 EAL domain-containing protein [Acidisoma cellulosilyticum]